MIHARTGAVDAPALRRDVAVQRRHPDPRFSARLPPPPSPPLSQVYVTWSGPAVGAVKRAKAMSSRAAMRAKLGNASVDVEVSAREDLTLDMVRS